MEETKKTDLWVFMSQSIMGIAYAALGIFLISRSNFVWSILYIVVVLLLLGSSLVFLYRFIRYRVRTDLFKFLGAFIASIVFYANEVLYVELLAGVFGIWALFNAFVHGLEIYLGFKEKEKISLSSVFLFFFDLGFGLMLILNGLANRRLVNLQVGTYLMVFGAVHIVSSTLYLLQGRSAIRMSAPVLISGILPPFVVDRVPQLKETSPDFFKDEVEPTLGNYVSVYIHIRNEGYNRLGHVDIGYNGAIYSYGAHDPYKRAFSSIYGAGVMIVGGEKEFVEFAVRSKNSVYRYLIRLTDEQAHMIEERINQLFEDAYVYDFPYWEDKTGEHYLTRLKNYAPTMTYYKFHSEPYKTYNLFTTNCVLIADHLLQSTGMKLFQMSGVITPGSYYAYLENLCLSPDSIVVSKSAYSEKV